MTAARQIVYRDRDGKITVDVINTDHSHSGSNYLLPDVPVEVSGGLLAERRGQRLLADALDRR